MSYILADDILLKVAVVDRLTADASFLAIKSPSIMDLDLTHPAVVISSPDVAMITPTTVASLDQTMTYSEFLLKPENLDLGSPTLIPNFKEMNIVGSGPMIDSRNEPAEYFREGYIEEDEPMEYFRPPYIEDEDEPEEYFRPPHLEVNADDEPEAYFRPAFIETDSEKLLRSVETWLEGLHSPVAPPRFPVTPPWRKSTVVEANLRPISLLNEPFYPEEEVKREFCPLGDLLGLMTADGWCLGCGAKHLSSGNDGPVFDFAPQLELPAFNPFNMI